jgi:hypothetical protein
MLSIALNSVSQPIMALRFDILKIGLLKPPRNAAASNRLLAYRLPISMVFPFQTIIQVSFISFNVVKLILFIPVLLFAHSRYQL